MLPKMKSLDTLLPQLHTVCSVIYRMGVSDDTSDPT